MDANYYSKNSELLKHGNISTNNAPPTVHQMMHSLLKVIINLNFSVTLKLLTSFAVITANV
jgi:hypothetical protein